MGAWVFGLVIAWGVTVGPVSLAEDAAAKPPTKGVRYRKVDKTIDFESHLVKGQLERPDVMVVTGNAPDGTDGLLRLRENFLDRVAIDAGEEVK